MLRLRPSRAPQAAIGIVMSLATALVGWAQDPEPEDLDVISEWRLYSDAHNAAYHSFQQEAFRLLSQRRTEVDALSSREDWERRRTEVRNALTEVVGAFPERTPLNPQIVGTVSKEGFRVEKLVYESVPGFYVTAALFVPSGLDSPAPGILFCSGHAAEGFRAPAYQTMILNLVQKGFVVLAFDPIGQGERVDYPSHELVTGPTKQHSYPGAQGFLLGGSPARQMIWDGIRGIDYLVSRSEVDPERLGVAGRSGGGTQSAYIAAFDERVRAAAPEAYITSFLRLLSSAGPQDVEQNFFHYLAKGLDHADLLIARAPKPTLIIATTRDFFSIQGARETFAEVKRGYEVFGKRDAIQIAEDDAPHASTTRNREAMYAFFLEALSVAGSPSEVDLPHLSEEELRVTPTGQLHDSLGGETLFSLHRDLGKARVNGLKRSRQTPEAHLPRAVMAARSLSGYRHPDRVEKPVFAGRYLRDGYRVEKYLLEGEGTDALPYLIMLPEPELAAPPWPAVIFLHPDGKAARAEPGGEMERFVRAGYLVAAPDVLGIGETGDSDFRGDAHFRNVSYNEWFAGILVGRSLAGERARDVVRLAWVLRDRSDVDGSRIAAVSHGELGSALLHAAAFEPALSRVALLRPLVSFASLVRIRDYDPRFVPSSVAGALTAYDLPDLAASLAPRGLWAGGATDGAGNPVSLEDVKNEWAVARSVYDRDGSSALAISEATDIDELIAWLERGNTR